MERIPLHLVDDNPFQARQEYGALDDLTISLLAQRDNRPETSGLLQIPLARQIDGRFELVIGHRRKRAFLALAHAGQDEYGTLPVEIVAFGDEAMADAAWEENARRLDLSDIERAFAIERALEHFGWTQAELGNRWGLTQGAVSNLLRLLRLPSKVQALIRDRVITGRHGRALLPLLPLEGRVEVYLGLLEEAPGLYRPVETVEALVENWIEQHTYNLADVAWDEEWDPGVEGTRACAGCQFHIKARGQWRCASSGSCCVQKESVYNLTVVGPRRAAAIYREYDTWDAVQVDRDNTWINCLGCHRNVREVQTGEPWLSARLMYNVRLCPLCAEAAGLQPSAPQVSPDFAPESSATRPASTFAAPPFQGPRGDRWTEFTPDEPEPEPPAVAVSPIERAAVIRLRLAPGDDPGRSASVAVQYEGEWNASRRYEDSGTAGDVFALLEKALAYIEAQRRKGTLVEVFAEEGEGGVGCL